jgi:glycosyltransferase involved in cell wall biosynthesis
MISLIVATVDRVPELDRLLASLEEQSYRDFEVIVIDQNPDNRLVPVLSRHACLRIEHLRSERGLSRARNVGLGVAQGDIVAIPDDDCWYPKDLLLLVVEWLESHPGFGLLNTALRDGENKSSGPNLPRASCRCTKSNVWRCAISTAMFMQRSVTTAIGRFNEDIGVGARSAYQSGEETDYVLRALEQGFEMWYESSLTVHHQSLDSIERLRKTTYPFALGTGCVLRMHEYPLYEVGAHLIRSLGGAAVSLSQGNLAKAQVYVLRGAGQLVGYVSGPRDLGRAVLPAGK